MLAPDDLVEVEQAQAVDAHHGDVAVVEDGKARMKRFLPIGITVDERVTSGAHFSGFFGSICRYFAHPELLEVPPEKVLFDPGCEYHVPKQAQQQASKEGTTISA